MFKGKTRVLIFCLLALLLVVLPPMSAACGDDDDVIPTPTVSPTPTPTPTPTPPLTEEWSADGIIRVREYYGANTYGDYQIHWRSDEQHIYVGMRAKTEGFVAMAIQPGSRMKNADMVFGFVKDGETTIYDLFSTGDFGPHPPDTELGGTDDILEFGGTEVDGYTTVEFKRALNTGDEYDNEVSPGSNKIIWSYGSSDSLSRKHSNRGYGELEL